MLLCNGGRRICITLGSREENLGHFQKLGKYHVVKKKKTSYGIKVWFHNLLVLFLHQRKLFLSDATSSGNSIRRLDGLDFKSVRVWVLEAPWVMRRRGYYCRRRDAVGLEIRRGLQRKRKHWINDNWHNTWQSHPYVHKVRNLIDVFKIFWQWRWTESKGPFCSDLYT